jgi:flagellar biosynthesis/type III secretory pathway protein FliH
MQFLHIDERAAESDPMFEDYSSQPTAAPRPDVEESSLEAGDTGEALDPQDESLYPASEVEELQQRHQSEMDALRADYEAQIEAGRSSALEEGRAEAKTEADQRIKALEASYAGLIEDMNAQILERLGEVERQAVEFSMQVAKKLVGSIVELNPEYILPVVQEAMKLTGGATIKAIRVSPHDLEAIKSLSPERQFKEFDGTWSFVADETIRQGCIIETAAGSAEYDLEKAWERIREQVIRVR